MENIAWIIFRYSKTKPIYRKKLYGLKSNFMCRLNVEKLNFVLEGCPNRPTKTI